MALSDWQKELDGCVQEAHGTGGYAIIGAAEILWSGWEGDTDAVLFRLVDGRKVWAALQAVHVAPDDVPTVLRQRVTAYRQAIAETESLLIIAGRCDVLE
ncbi:hypothetical protein [Microvirga makkahensis]|uniref:Uncharacterized protein n=1 Tax=Microvirga makkahensis TaxID=1128670 RepID=A0A7X3MNW5_9HYPH|nr:hypothetical protein [Microvirga makkahensis]MXQ10455.1 hypothetical protein [Microvirga makkahensis]